MDLKSLINRNPKYGYNEGNRNISSIFIQCDSTTFKIATTTMEVGNGHHQLYLKVEG